jgi:radical SAM superfamily enzyme YgiQ (UPF0313 family)
MRKPPADVYDRFAASFAKASRAASKQQYLVPYFIAGHPGCTLDHMIELALFLKQRSIRPRQVQQFVATPMTLATAMAYSGIDPMTGDEVYTAHGAEEKRLQKALLLYWDRAQHSDVRRALRMAGRPELIGAGEGCLVPPASGRGAPPRRGRSNSRRRGR